MDHRCFILCLTFIDIDYLKRWPISQSSRRHKWHEMNWRRKIFTLMLFWNTRNVKILSRYSQIWISVEHSVNIIDNFFANVVILEVHVPFSIKHEPLMVVYSDCDALKNWTSNTIYRMRRVNTITYNLFQHTNWWQSYLFVVFVRYARTTQNKTTRAIKKNSFVLANYQFNFLIFWVY